MRIIDALRSRQQSYISFAQWFAKSAGVKNTELAPGAMLAIAHLAKFCRWGETCFHQDPRIHAVLEGRREVMQLILDYMNLPVDELIRVRKIPYLKEIDID